MSERALPEFEDCGSSIVSYDKLKVCSEILGLQLIEHPDTILLSVVKPLVSGSKPLVWTPVVMNLHACRLQRQWHIVKLELMLGCVHLGPDVLILHVDALL